jgi:hypothetical protein
MDIGLEGARSCRARGGGGESRDTPSRRCRLGAELLASCRGMTGGCVGVGEEDVEVGERGGPPNWDMNDITEGRAISYEQRKNGRRAITYRESEAS